MRPKTPLCHYTPRVALCFNRMEIPLMDQLFEQDASLEKYQTAHFVEAAKAMLRQADTLSDESLLGARAVLLLNGLIG